MPRKKTRKRKPFTSEDADVFNMIENPAFILPNGDQRLCTGICGVEIFIVSFGKCTCEYAAVMGDKR